MTFLQRFHRRLASAVLAINAVAGDAKGRRPEFAGIQQTGQALVNGQPDFLSDVLHQMWRCLHHFSRKEKQVRSVQPQQFLKRQFVADLASDNERLLIKLLRIGGHVPFTTYAAARSEKVNRSQDFRLGREAEV